MRLGGTDQWPTSQKGISLSWLHVISYFDSMALFLWPSWSSLVLETLLRRPLFFYTSAHTRNAHSWTGNIFSKTLRKDQKVVVFRWSFYFFSGAVSSGSWCPCKCSSLLLIVLSPSRCRVWTRSRQRRWLALRLSRSITVKTAQRTFQDDFADVVLRTPRKIQRS